MPPQLPDTPNGLQDMMKLEQAKRRAKTANKVALEVEKEKDDADKAVEELKRQLQPKRARTDDDAADAHEMLAEVDDWHLRDHRQQTTRGQNRRNVQVGSRKNQPKPHTDTDGFLYHDRLGLVGWISYWCCGDTFQEWDPSAGSDDTSAPVAMFVNSSELRVTDFPLEEVRPFQLDTVRCE